MSRGIRTGVLVALLLLLAGAGLIYLGRGSSKIPAGGGSRATKKTPAAAKQTAPRAGARQVAATPTPWIKISAGSFSMGSPASDPCREAGETRHRATLTRGFEMQTTEVTQDQFRELMGYNPSSFQRCGGRCPVDCRARV